MDSGIVTGCTEDTIPRGTDGGVSASQQLLQDVDDRLVTLSENISVCNQVLNDLKNLRDALKRKPIEDVSLPPQK